MNQLSDRAKKIWVYISLGLFFKLASFGVVIYTVTQFGFVNPIVITASMVGTIFIFMGAYQHLRLLQERQK